MKKTILFLFMFVALCLQTMAQKPKIRVKETPTPDISTRQGYFKPGTSFEKDKRYYSEDNRYALVFQADGNLVIYKFSTKTKYQPVWNSHTNGIAMKSCVFQTDGNLVLYDFTNKARWNALTETKKTDKFAEIFMPRGATGWMVLQNDGNLVIYFSRYPSTRVPFWSSGSFEKN